jgi:hypothetical protein
MSDINFTINSTSAPIKLGTIGIRLAGLNGTATDVTYTNDTETYISVGGISTGETFDSQTVVQMFDRLLYPYVQASISLNSSPNPSVQEFGTSIDSVTLNVNVTKMSNNITKIWYYKNGVLINENDSPNPNGGMNSFVDNNSINMTTTYYVSVTDDKPYTINSSSTTFQYVYPFYVGDVSSQNPTESDIKAMNKQVKVKSNTTYNYTLTNSRFAIAFDSSLGLLTHIYDANMFDITSDFTLSTLIFTMLDGQNIQYNVYVNNNMTTQTGFNVYYNF